MRRREFILLLGGAAAAHVSWPLTARTPQANRIPRLGVLLFSTPQNDPSMAVARRGLRDLGYIEGQNLAIEYFYAEGRPERLPALAAELVGTKPDVMFAIGGDVQPAAVKETRGIRIVVDLRHGPGHLGFCAGL